MDGLVSFLFYDSIIAFFMGIPAFIFYFRNTKKRLIKKRLNLVREQFCEMINSLSTSIAAGLSLENSIIESKKEMVNRFGEDSYISIELSDIVSKIKLNKPIEVCLLDFSERSGIEEIKDFMVIFVHAKRSGGSFKDIILRTVKMMREKSDTEKEIAVLLNGKKYEQKVMNLIPFLIIAYLRLSSPEFIAVLYHNKAGIAVMTICLGVFLLAIFLSEKISDISV